MRVLVQRLRARLSRGSRPAKPTGTCYRSASYPPLRPWQVRGRQFTGRGRRGVDAAEVADFLDRVADDLAAAYAAVAAAREETGRIKDALKQWQSRQATLVNSGARW
jgi:DivIVA domain-containing protein